MFKVSYSKVQFVWRATKKSCDLIIALKIGKIKIFGFSHFEGKYQCYCTCLAYIIKAKQSYLCPKYNNITVINSRYNIIITIINFQYNIIIITMINNKYNIIVTTTSINSEIIIFLLQSIISIIILLLL